MLARYALEAKALRAFGYYCLVTSFGDVPLITEPKLPSEGFNYSSLFIRGSIYSDYTGFGRCFRFASQKMNMQSLMPIV